MFFIIMVSELISTLTIMLLIEDARQSTYSQTYVYIIDDNDNARSYDDDYKVDDEV